MYKKNLDAKKITLRLDEETWAFVTELSEAMDLTPSAFIRMSLKSLKISMKGLVDSHVDEQTHINDKLQQ